MATISHLLLHHLLILLTITPPTLSTHQPQNQPQPQSPLHQQGPLHTTLRPIHATDLDALTTIIVDAFSPSAQWHYIFPNLTHQRREIWHCYNSAIRREWPVRNPNTTFGNVIALQPEDEPVALAVWNLRLRGDDEGEDGDQRDSNASPFLLLPSLLSSSPACAPLNTTRATALMAQLASRENAHFSHLSQLYLKLLATHPSYDGHGFAAQNLHWGMRKARRDWRGLPVTLMATPAGWPVYEAEGFAGLENVTVEMGEGEGELWFEVARWDGE